MSRSGAGWAALAALVGAGVCRAVDTSASCGLDSVPACTCMLGASLFEDLDGCSPEQCAEAHGGGGEEDGSLKGLVDGCVARAKGLQRQCEEMQTVVKCTRELGCYDSIIRGACANLTNVDPQCALDCGRAPRAALGGPLLAALLAAGLALRA